jgi:hypothetical protein
VLRPWERPATTTAAMHRTRGPHQPAPPTQSRAAVPAGLRQPLATTGAGVVVMELVTGAVARSRLPGDPQRAAFLVATRCRHLAGVP